MSTRTPPAQAHLNEELRHIRDLVFLRELLRERGATPTELRECDAAIDGARGDLAAASKQAAAASGAAA